jgi:serine/threonine protein phosphatase PrpC
VTTEGSGASRAGEDGTHNEDAFLVEEGLGLYVVCDGASEGPAGEVASRVAARALERFVEDAEAEFGSEWHESHGALAVVVKAMDHAMAALAAAEQTDSERLGLATTITLLLAHGRHGVIGHRGDSRAYLVRRGRCHQLTIDHELTDSISPGDGAERDFEVFALELNAGDTFILCTDGAEEVVRDREIIRVVGNLTPRLIASRIVSAAHRRSPSLDATAVVVRVRSERERGWLELSSLPKGTTFGHTLFRE